LDPKSMKRINVQSLPVCNLVYQRGVVVMVLYMQITKIYIKIIFVNKTYFQSSLYIILTLTHNIKGATHEHKRCVCKIPKGSNDRCHARLHGEPT
jgi:hypothetical protein